MGLKIGVFSIPSRTDLLAGQAAVVFLTTVGGKRHLRSGEANDGSFCCLFFASVSCFPLAVLLVLQRKHSPSGSRKTTLTSNTAPTPTSRIPLCSTERTSTCLSDTTSTGVRKCAIRWRVLWRKEGMRFSFRGTCRIGRLGLRARLWMALVGLSWLAVGLLDRYLAEKCSRFNNSHPQTSNKSRKTRTSKIYRNTISSPPYGPTISSNALKTT